MYYFLIAAFHNYLYWMTKHFMEDTPILSASKPGIYLIRRCCQENGYSSKFKSKCNIEYNHDKKLFWKTEAWKHSFFFLAFERYKFQFKDSLYGRKRFISIAFFLFNKCCSISLIECVYYVRLQSFISWKRYFSAMYTFRDKRKNSKTLEN